VNVGKDVLVFEIEKAVKGFFVHHVLKEELGGVVGGDANGEHAAGKSGRAKLASICLSEDGIEVDVTTSAQRVNF
jgi:hypothetical protein